MSILTDFKWKAKYTPDDGNLLKVFYLPALSSAVRYDRTTGFFKPDALAKAAIGVEELIRNNGRMRLIVGCTLDKEEVDAIERGESLRDTVEGSLLKYPFQTDSPEVQDALELLAWMVTNGYLEVQIAVPCDRVTGKPRAGVAIFHEKAGILEDKTGNRLVFNGSLNETYSGWTQNWESFHVYCSWKDDHEHLDAEETSFQRLWADQDKAAKVMQLGKAVKEDLLRFLPKDGEKPKRLQEGPQTVFPPDETPPEPTPEEPQDRYKTAWDLIYDAPKQPGTGDYIGEATSAVTPWPHQARAFDRMYQNWPPRLLIADEVGLGKTIEAGLVIRQAWLSGRAKRILIMAPKAVLRQWQIELREKFNLNVPIYEDGALTWYPSPAMRENFKRNVSDAEWHKEPFVLASSHLMRRKERTKQLLEEAEPWDLVVLDEAHHARREISGKEKQLDRPNRLMRLMRGLKDKTAALILLTATPMQIHPLEVWDLMNLLGLPEGWSADSFLKFFELTTAPAPTEKELSFMAALFQSMEARYSPMTEDEAMRITSCSKLKTRKILAAIRERGAITPLMLLTAEERRFALRIMKAYSPTRMLISRNTRELLRRYRQEGMLSTNIADRNVSDFMVQLTPEERCLYEEVEDYIATTYNAAAKDERTAIGFVMTIYRRRLASSFDALEQTLKKRLAGLVKGDGQLGFSDEDLPDDEVAEELMDSDDASKLERKALKLEEADRIRQLISAKQSLPPTDTKAKSLLTVIRNLKDEGYPQVIVFTQYTDTLDSLRMRVGREFGMPSILCFSGRGGERWTSNGWESLSREKTKELFRDGKAEILLCTDAAAEGLNLQTCGALVNYDMPWNPMKVEQRIGRIDRLGQKFSVVKIINLMYEKTVEADVYAALRDRIGLFSQFVGRLQPILSRLPKAFGDMALKKREAREDAGGKIIMDIDARIREQEDSGFDLGEIRSAALEMPVHPEPAYVLAYLGGLLRDPKMLPPGYDADVLAGGKDYAYLAPGYKKRIRVTTDAEFYEQHAESVELWSPGSPAFPWQKNSDGL